MRAQLNFADQRELTVQFRDDDADFRPRKRQCMPTVKAALRDEDNANDAMPSRDPIGGGGGATATSNEVLEEYCTVAGATRKLGLSKSAISGCLKKHHHSAHGHRSRYKNEHAAAAAMASSATAASTGGAAAAAAADMAASLTAPAETTSRATADSARAAAAAGADATGAAHASSRKCSHEDEIKDQDQDEDEVVKVAEATTCAARTRGVSLRLQGKRIVGDRLMAVKLRGITYVPRYSVWQAQLASSGTIKYLGQYTSADAAAHAYDTRARELRL